MTRVLLVLLFFVMLGAVLLSLDLSLAPGLSVKNAFLYLILLGIIIDTALRRNRDLELLSVSLPYALCIIYAIFTWVMILVLIDYPRYNPVRSFVNLKSNLGDHLIVLVVFFYGVLNAKDARSVLKAMLWIVMLANLISVMDALNMPDLNLISERDDGRVSGPMGESNQYAAYLALFMPPILGLALIESGYRRYLAYFGFVVSMVAFLMTVSRGGMVGVVGGCAIGAIFLRKYISIRSAMLAAAGLGSVIVIAVIGLYLAGFGDLFYDRFVGLAQSGSYGASSGRTFIWQTAINKMMESPITLIVGYGWDTYAIFPEFNLAPHNTYLKIFFELGFIGLFFVVLTLVNILRTARQGIRFGDPETATTLIAFTLGFLCMMVAVFFVDLTTPWLFIWAFAGATMRLAVAQIKSQAKKAKPRRSAFRPAQVARQA
jgi:putative inorganic carbon (HCO3(-)) transporter